MIRSLILRTSAALASAALVFASVAIVATSAQAATISYSDPNCSSFSITGTAPNYTLVCAKLACSVAANPASPTPGQNVTLTASCSPAASSVQWSLVTTGIGCPAAAGSANPTSITAPGTTVNGCVYQVDATSGVLTGQAQATVSWSNAPPQVPSGCTLVANPMSFPTGAGGTTALTASCSGGGAPTSFAWAASPSPAGFSTLTVSGSQSAAITATTFFTVTPSNSAGNGNQATVSVTVPGSVLGFCGQYGNVLPVLNATWGQQSSWHSQDSGNFGDNAVWVFKLVVPPGTANSINAGSFTTAEFNGPNTPRQLTISPTACDFRTQADKNGVNGPMVICQDGTSCQISYSVSVPKSFGGIAGLTAGQTYYINVRNWSNYPPPPSYDCGQTSCNAIMNHQPAFP